MTAPHPDVLMAIGVSIVAAAAFALVARTVRQPLILGYILAGAALGPNVGLGLIADEASIELISEMGLIFLLFIIGLEINIPALAQAGRSIVVSGLLQFPICVALAWWAFGHLVAGTGGRFDRLYLAVAVSLSSTLIVVKLLFDKFEMSTLAGRITLGVLVFQDLWAIVFLALQPSLQELRPAVLLGSVAAGVALVASAGVLSRYVLPALFRSVSRSHELLLVTAIAWCFLVSGTAGALGTVARDGRADRRDGHRRLPVRHRGRHPVVGHPRLLRDAVLRRARPQGAGAVAAAPAGGGGGGGVRGAEPPGGDAADLRVPAAGHPHGRRGGRQPGSDQRVLAGDRLAGSWPSAT